MPVDMDRLHRAAEATVFYQECVQEYLPALDFWMDEDVSLVKLSRADGSQCVGVVVLESGSATEIVLAIRNLAMVACGFEEEPYAEA